jgi:hypothetical protein
MSSQLMPTSGSPLWMRFSLNKTHSRVVYVAIKYHFIDAYVCADTKLVAEVVAEKLRQCKGVHICSVVMNTKKRYAFLESKI